MFSQGAATHVDIHAIGMYWGVFFWVSKIKQWFINVILVIYNQFFLFLLLVLVLFIFITFHILLFRWKMDPSQAVVTVKEGNTALPVGVLAVRGYDVKGSVTSFGSPISGIYVLLYPKDVR